MDINRIFYFVTIARAGSLAAASAILHVSPAALSKAMSVFESEFGAAVFRRSGRGIVLTEQGKALLPRAEQAIEQVKRLRPVEGSSHSVLRMATFEVFSTYFLGSLLRKHFPDWNLELRELLPGEIERAIANGHSDVGITYLPIPHSGVTFLSVGQVRMRVFGLAKFLQEKHNSLPFVVPIAPLYGSPTKMVGLDGWLDHEVFRLQKYRVTLMESALQLCREGLCVAYLPTFVAGMHNESVHTSKRLVEIPFPGLKASKNEVFLVQRSDLPENQVVRKIARAVRELG